MRVPTGRRRITRLRTHGEDGASLVETLVMLALIATAVFGWTHVSVSTSRYTVAAANYNGAQTVDQDVLGYLAGVPVNVVYRVASPDGGWSPAPVSLPGVRALYSTTIKVATAASDDSLAGSNLLVSARTCYTPQRGAEYTDPGPATPAPKCASAKIVRSGRDVAVTPPTNMPTATVPCDGTLGVASQCTPVLAAALGSNHSTVTVSVTRPEADGATVTYTLQRSATADFADPSALTGASNELASAGTTSDSVQAASGHERDYYYRVRYSAGAFVSAWSPTAKIAVAASHLACTTVTPVAPAESCTPQLSIGIPGSPITDGVDVPLTIVGPTGQVAYTIQASTEKSFTSGLTSMLAWSSVSSQTITVHDTVPAAPAIWYFRVSYADDAATGKPVWSPVQPIAVTGP